MKNDNVSVNSIVCPKMIVAGIRALVFVRIVGI